MNDQRPMKRGNSLEEHSRLLFHDSVDGLDFTMRSRLTQARSAAIDAALSKQQFSFFRSMRWAPAAGVGAAAVLGAALWLGSPGYHAKTAANGLSNLEDLEMLASSEEGPGNAMEMLQDDIDFYDYAEKADNAEPSV